MAEFEELMALMGVGEKKPDGGGTARASAGAPAAEPGQATEKKKIITSQKNNLLNYFGKKQ